MEVTTVTDTRPCNEWLWEAGEAIARCTEPYGTEHSHSDYTATEALAANVAAPLADGTHHVIVELHHGDIVTVREA